MPFVVFFLLSKTRLSWFICFLWKWGRENSKSIFFGFSLLYNWYRELQKVKILVKKIFLLWSSSDCLRSQEESPFLDYPEIICAPPLPSYLGIQSRFCHEPQNTNSILWLFAVRRMIGLMLKSKLYSFWTSLWIFDVFVSTCPRLKRWDVKVRNNKWKIHSFRPVFGLIRFHLIFTIYILIAQD